MGSWKHWVRNVDALGARFTVHALDHPSYGDSASVPRETTGPQYLDLVHALLLEALPGRAPLRFAGFSFGAAIAASMARRLGPRVSHLALISPGGFPMRKFGERPIRSYKEAGGDEPAPDLPVEALGRLERGRRDQADGGRVLPVVVEQQAVADGLAHEGVPGAEQLGLERERELPGRPAGEAEEAALLVDLVGQVVHAAAGPAEGLEDAGVDLAAQHPDEVPPRPWLLAHR
jgi:pimeloyl-ACP methyl ester carboxylesterase